MTDSAHEGNSQPVNQNNVTVVNNVSTPSHRGAGTVLMFVFFWWVLILWWALLLKLWILWLPVAGIVTIFRRGFFTRTWYCPWPAWMFGIR